MTADDILQDAARLTRRYAAQIVDGRRHGMNCAKAPHSDHPGGYLHSEDDDTPYDVDGISYCGRCHVALN